MPRNRAILVLSGIAAAMSASHLGARVPSRYSNAMQNHSDLDPSITRAGSFAAFGVAVAYLASGLCAALMPPELQGRPDIAPHEFWMALCRDPFAHLGFHWSWIVAGVCGLGAVPAISLVVWEQNRGAMLWSGTAALVGFAVLARSHLMEVAFDRRVIVLYPDADVSYQQAVHVAAGLALDVPDGFLTYGAIGVWVLVVSRLGSRSGALPARLCRLGELVALTSLLGVVGYTFAIRPLLLLSIGLGGSLLTPAWYAWMGLVLRRRAAA